MGGAKLLISGATVIDAISPSPLERRSIAIEGERIAAIAGPGELAASTGVDVIDAQGKYVIPGLMNANVHLLGDTFPENLTRNEGRYEALIEEAAQVALKAGLTTVFDTWGPRRFLMAVRDRIDAGKAPGSRIRCGGNIVGFDGPFSPDFAAKAPEAATAALVKRINAIWVENVGRQLMWLPASEVARHVREYIGRGIDFVKYASNEHGGPSAGAFLQFSSRVQSAIVEEAHRAGLTAQAHTMTVEGLRTAIDAGCDLIQHANITGPVPIPEDTLESIASRGTGAVVFPWTEQGLERLKSNGTERTRAMWSASDANARNLLRAGAALLMGNDGALFTPELSNDPALTNFWGPATEDRLIDLPTGHIAWFKAMEEKGCPPMEMLKAATVNIARAYGVGDELGTLEPGKIADMLVLDRNPLDAAENYRSIHTIIKAGCVVNRDTLPISPILTKPVAPPVEEEASYVSFFTAGASFPACPMCMCR